MSTASFVMSEYTLIRIGSRSATSEHGADAILTFRLPDRLAHVHGAKGISDVLVHVSSPLSRHSADPGAARSCPRLFLHRQLVFCIAVSIPSAFSCYGSICCSRPFGLPSAASFVLTSGRFFLQRIASTPLLKFFPAPVVLIAYGCMTSVFSLVAAVTGGKAGIAALFLVFWGESVIYPTTFTLATSNLGRHTKRGAGILVRCFADSRVARTIADLTLARSRSAWVSPVALSSRPFRVSGLTHRTPRFLVSIFFFFSFHKISPDLSL